MKLKFIQEYIDILRGKRLSAKEVLKTNKWFSSCYKEFKKKDSNPRFTLKEKDFYPCLKDKTSTTGYEPHYTYHPAWALRVLSQTKPKKHIDISSITQFSTALSAFIPVEFYDYRPVDIKLSNLECKSANVCKLDFADESIESLSCMHVVEHIGLGRYGDEIDPEGDLTAIKELKRVLAKGGDLLFVVPMAQEAKIQFNAHRIYTFKMILEYFDGLELKNFAFVKDDGEFIEHAAQSDTDGQKWGCGCFWFRKNEA